MAENSNIEWTHHTFNPWIGCAKVSAGCKNCYAETLMDTRYGRVKWGVNGTRVRTGPDNWKKPRQWDKAAAKAGERHRVFCASLADVFEDRPELVEWRTDLFKLIDDTPNLDWLLLTKRPENIVNLWPDAEERENVWLGTSVENQEQAMIRIDAMMMPAALCKYVFLSCEPLIGPVDLFKTVVDPCDEAWEVVNADSDDCEPEELIEECEQECDWINYGPAPVYNREHAEWVSARRRRAQAIHFGMWVNWVIVGGESGSGRRPFDPEWARDIRYQCRQADVAFFMKQIDKVIPIPDDLFIREFPTLQMA